MFTLIPSLCFLLVIGSLPTGTAASPSAWKSSLFRRFVFSPERFHRRLNYNPDGSAFLWLPQDTYAGQPFFEQVVTLFCAMFVDKNYLFFFLQWFRLLECSWSNRVCIVFGGCWMWRVRVLIEFSYGCISAEVKSSMFFFPFKKTRITNLLAM